MLTAEFLEQQFSTLADELIADAQRRQDANRHIGKAWSDAWRLSHRQAICSALKIDRGDPLAFFATFPFRIMQHEDQRWIAGAIGCESLLAPSRGDYPWLTIRDVILWQPRTGALQLLGEAPRAANLITPAAQEDRLTVYGDGFAFFRAWANRRAILAASAIERRKQRYAQPVREPADNCLPGALVIGDMDRIAWREADAQILVAGPGIDPAKLKRAVFRAARIPRIEAAA